MSNGQLGLFQAPLLSIVSLPGCYIIYTRVDIKLTIGHKTVKSFNGALLPSRPHFDGERLGACLDLKFFKL